MLLRSVILGLGITAACALQAQNHSFIGMARDEVKQLMKEDYKDFSIDNSITKQEFNYLKFVNASQTITWIIYLSGDDICTSTKKVCDYLEYDRITDELNEMYGSDVEHQWEYSDENESYVISLEEKDWYFTLRERRKE